MKATGQGADRPLPGMFDAPTAIFLAATLCFLYCFLFIPPFLPIDHSGDYVLFIASAKRMYEGEVLYRDFFEFLTPGFPVFFSWLFKIFGPRLWIPNLVLLFLGTSLAWISVFVAKRLMPLRIAFLPSAIFVAGVFKNYLDPTHHWFSLLTAMAAVAAVVERRSAARIAVAGSFCGLTLWFTESRGLAVLAGLAIYLWWECRKHRLGRGELIRREIWLAGSSLTTLAVLDAYFIWKAGPDRFFWCTILFVMRFWPKFSAWNPGLAFIQNLPDRQSFLSLHYSSVEWLFIYAVVPLVYALFFVRYRQASAQWTADFWDRPMLLAIVGACMLLSSAPTPSPFRLTVSELPGILLLVWLITTSRKLQRTLVPVLAAGVLFVAGHSLTKAQPKEMQILATPQGALAVTDRQAYEEYTWVQQHTRPLDYFLPVSANFYFYLNLRNPIPTNELTNSAYTTREQVAGALRGLRSHRPRYIMWSPVYLDNFIKWQDPSEDHLGPLRNYLHGHYRVAKVFPNSDTVWERED